jgi:hypothetical protein
MFGDIVCSHQKVDYEQNTACYQHFSAQNIYGMVVDSQLKGAQNRTGNHHVPPSRTRREDKTKSMIEQRVEIADFRSIFRETGQPEDDEEEVESEAGPMVVGHR